MSLLQRCGGIWPTHLGRIVVIQHIGGFSSMNRLLRSCHSISIGFRSGLWLDTPKSSFCFSSAIQRWICVCVWIIVLLQNPSSLQLEVTNRWPDIVLQDFLVDSRIHGSIYHSKSSRSWAAKQPQTIMLPPPYFTVGMISFSEMLCYFYTRCNGTHTFQKVQLLSRQSTEYFPKELGIIKIFSGKLRWAFMFFLLSSGFGLGLCHAGHFCLVSFLWWSHEHWP